MADGDLTEFEHPFRFTPDGAAEIEQGSPQDIQQRVYALLCFEPGDRIELPEYGVPEQAFKKGGADLEQIRSLIEYWEPEAVEVIEASYGYDQLEPGSSVFPGGDVIPGSQWLNTLVQRVIIRRDLNA